VPWGKDALTTSVVEHVPAYVATPDNDEFLATAARLEAGQVARVSCLPEPTATAATAMVEVVVVAAGLVLRCGAYKAYQ
jgi:hypothetical protein